MDCKVDSSPLNHQGSPILTTSFIHIQFPVGLKLSACELELVTKLLVWVKMNSWQPGIHSFLFHPGNIRLESRMENPFSPGTVHKV